MRIDKQLNLIVPIFGDEQPRLDSDGNQEKNEDGTPATFQQIVAYVYSTPLSAESVERHWLVLAQTFAAIFSRGLGVVAGPTMAMRMLKKIGEENRVWDGPTGVRGVIDEMRRLTTVAIPAAAGGWEGVPLHVAVDRNFITAEDQAETENAIIFFICVSATLARAQRELMLVGSAGLWSARVSSSTFTELLTSLKTSTAPATIGASEPAAAAAQASPHGRTISATSAGKPLQLPH
jgi:hypothetical protein